MNVHSVKGILIKLYLNLKKIILIQVKLSLFIGIFRLDFTIRWPPMKLKLQIVPKNNDEMFKKTTSNGNGLTKDQIKQIALDLSLNGANIISCADSDKYKDEVAKDISDASAVGVSGTPAFFIGKSNSSGTIEGQLIEGAHPYASFKAVIEAALK